MGVVIEICIKYPRGKVECMLVINMMYFASCVCLVRSFAHLHLK
jgi:hypothetical protein